MKEKALSPSPSAAVDRPKGPLFPPPIHLYRLSPLPSSFNYGVCLRLPDPDLPPCFSARSRGLSISTNNCAILNATRTHFCFSFAHTKPHNKEPLFTFTPAPVARGTQQYISREKKKYHAQNSRKLQHMWQRSAPVVIYLHTSEYVCTYIVPLLLNLPQKKKCALLFRRSFFFVPGDITSIYLAKLNFYIDT